MTTSALPRAAAFVGVAFFIGFGLWAFVDPTSFYDELATFPPYNEHLFHDVGAFQVGLGAVLLLALLGWPSLAAALGGVAAGAVLHAVAHAIDSDKGGRDSDPWMLGLLALVFVVAAVMARPRTSVGQPVDAR